MEKNWNQYWSNIMMKLCKNDETKLYSLGQNNNLTLKTIEQHINEPWDWTTISRNSNVTLEDTSMIAIIQYKPYGGNSSPSE